MKPITLRNVPPEVARVIRRRARERRTSLNCAVIELLQEACDPLTKPVQPRPPDAIDELAGVWTMAEARAFNKRLFRERRIDPELWT